MKFLISALLASYAVAQNPVSQPGVYTDENGLEAAWKMDEPTVSYASSTNTFTLSYGTTTYFKNFASGINLNEEFYTTACKVDESESNVISNGIFSPTGTSTPSAAMTQDPSTGQMTLQFKIDPAIVSANSNIYTDSDNIGTLSFCVRASIGYGGSSSTSLSLQGQINAGFEEVNFIESLLTIEYDLKADFAVLEINVKPKEKITTTFDEDEYGIQAWLCNITAAQADYDFYTYTPTGGTSVNRYYPPAADTTNPFNQGSLISVCIRPQDTSYAEGIVMKEIVTFNWERSAATTGDTTIDVTQEAVKESAAAANLLTYYPDCQNDAFCRISSILFADFYISEGKAQGSGTAKTQFIDTARRLGEDRALQEAETAGSQFDVTVSVTANDDGPGALKTAGGVSLGFTALASFMALAGSMLFF